MKAYTDLEQSKKLAEFLPLESADMHYNNISIRGINYVDEYRAELMKYNRAIKVLSKYTINPLFEVVPCWSLAALLCVLKHPRCFQGDKPTYWFCGCFGKDNLYYEVEADNPVDTCVEMILKLNEQNLL